MEIHPGLGDAYKERVTVYWKRISMQTKFHHPICINY